MSAPRKTYKEGYVPDAPRRCHMFPKTLSHSLTFPVARTLKKRGFQKADLLRHWEAIVGPELGRRCQPVKLIQKGYELGNGVLELRTPGVYATEIQHAAPQILERLATYYGYPVAGRITLLQSC